MYLYRLLVLLLCFIIISCSTNGQLLGGLLSSSDGGLITSVLGGGSTTSTTTGGGSTTGGGGGPIIDIDLGPISLELYLAIQDPANQIRFISWTNQYNKTYSASEFQKRYKIYVDNSLYVNSFNTTHPNSTFQVGLNGFADLTLTEFITIYVSGLIVPNVTSTTTTTTTIPLSTTTTTSTTDIPITTHSTTTSITTTATTGELSNINLPSSRSLLGVTAISAVYNIDWTYKLPPVKDQGSCGSCYAFSAIATIEALLYDQRIFEALSEQEIVDCTKPRNSGCNGGWPTWVYEYVFNNGIAAEFSNKYMGREYVCLKTNPRYFLLKNHTEARNETEIYNNLRMYGPVSVTVHSRSRDWQLYVSGIYQSVCDEYVDHAVAIVGAKTDIETGINYWIVRNSWGRFWGERGYIRIRSDIGCVHNGRSPIRLDH